MRYGNGQLARSIQSALSARLVCAVVAVSLSLSCRAEDRTPTRGTAVDATTPVEAERGALRPPTDADSLRSPLPPGERPPIRPRLAYGTVACGIGSSQSADSIFVGISCPIPRDTVGGDTVVVHDTVTKTIVDTVSIPSKPDTVFACQPGWTCTPPKPNTPPVAAFTVACDSVRCSFVSTSTDADADSLTCRWDTHYPDVPTPEMRRKTGCRITRTPPTGLTTWREQLRVRDARGALDTASQVATLVIPPPIDTTTPPPGPVLPPAPLTIAAAPIRSSLRTSPNFAKMCDVHVPSGGNWAAAAASGVDVVCLQPGGTYSGNVVLGPHGKAGWVEIRTDTPIPLGTRVRPSTATNLAKLISRGAGSIALTVSASARRYAFTGVEIMPDPAMAGGAQQFYSIVELQGDSLLFRHSYIHGGTSQWVRRCVKLSSGLTIIVDSWLDECHENGSDSQAIVGFDGRGPYHIENNTLSGAGENVMWGGARPGPSGVPCDITMRRNHLYTPPTWNRKVHPATGWLKKNLLETKNVCRLEVSYNVLDGSWGDGQDGYAVMFKSANGGATGYNTAQSRDILFWRNLIVNTGSGIAVFGIENTAVRNDSLTARVVIEENYVANINMSPSYVGVDRMLFLSNNAENVIVRRNTFDHGSSGSYNTLLSSSAGKVGVRGLVIEHNALPAGRYTFAGCAQPATFAACFPGAVSTGNALYGSGTQATPPGFARTTSLSSALASTRAPSRAQIDQWTAGVVVPR